MESVELCPAVDEVLGGMGGRRCYTVFKLWTVYSWLRWLDTVFQGQYLPSLSVNYVAINKNLEKLTPQLY